MTLSLPATIADFMPLSWSQIEPYYLELSDYVLSSQSLELWLQEWTRLSAFVSEMGQRLYVATSINTADTEAEKRLFDYLDNISPPVEAAEQRLRKKLLDSGLEPGGFEIPLRNMRAQAALFRDANLPLLTEERKLENQYNKLIGAQTVEWYGKDVTITQLRPVYQNNDRDLRESAWRSSMDRQLADRAAINDLWGKFMQLRGKLAENSGCSDYRSFRWRQLLRFDYTPADCTQFHEAIEKVAVPAAIRIYERRRMQLGVEVLRPWDLDVDPLGRESLRPFSQLSSLEDKVSEVFNKIDPQLGEYFAIMRHDGLLDLDNRKGKAPGAYCTSYAVAKRPFIFMNAVGLHDDVQTLLHESGHAFHVFESAKLPYMQQLEVGMEFAEVASMSMELLAQSYLSMADIGFYTRDDGARATIEHLEGLILFWPYMAVVDAFQHWVYTHHDEASEPVNCDAEWARLWQRFMPGVDWSGLDQAMMTGWHRKLHIHQVPFYYVEYGLAQLGSVQVWRNSLQDRSLAVQRYRQALALGCTVALPSLYEVAGAKLAFDHETLSDAVNVVEDTIQKLSV